MKGWASLSYCEIFFEWVCLQHPFATSLGSSVNSRALISPLFIWLVSQPPLERQERCPCVSAACFIPECLLSWLTRMSKDWPHNTTGEGFIDTHASTHTSQPNSVRKRNLKSIIQRKQEEHEWSKCQDKPTIAPGIEPHKSFRLRSTYVRIKGSLFHSGLDMGVQVFTWGHTGNQEHTQDPAPNRASISTFTKLYIFIIKCVSYDLT